MSGFSCLDAFELARGEWGRKLATRNAKPPTTAFELQQLMARSLWAVFVAGLTTSRRATCPRPNHCPAVVPGSSVMACELVDFSLPERPMRDPCRFVKQMLRNVVRRELQRGQGGVRLLPFPVDGPAADGGAAPAVHYDVELDDLIRFMRERLDELCDEVAAGVPPDDIMPGVNAKEFPRCVAVLEEAFKRFAEQGELDLRSEELFPASHLWFTGSGDLAARKRISRTRAALKRMIAYLSGGEIIFPTDDA